MSEFAVPSLSDLPPTPRPEALLGVASPLWAYYLGAAASGVAWWWITRWTQAANLEALFGAAGFGMQATDEARSFAAPAETLVSPVESAADAAAAVLAAGEALAEPLIDIPVQAAAATTTAVNDAIETAAPAIDAAVDSLPEAVGGEPAPISPSVVGLEAASPAEPLTAQDAAPEEPRVRSRPTPPAAPVSEG